MKEKQQQNTYHAEREEILTRQDRIMPKLVISQYDVNPPGMWRGHIEHRNDSHDSYITILVNLSDKAQQAMKCKQPFSCT